MSAAETGSFIIGLDHVQVAMPAGEEEKARAFYHGILGLAEIPKPEALAKRGGVWFNLGSHQLHLGVELDFRPARKAHPAFLVSGLQALQTRVRTHGLEPVTDDPLPGQDRFFLSDPFGNRLEFVERHP